MARVEGFEGGRSGIAPGTLVPVSEVGVWGDSDTGLGVFGSSNTNDAVVGHSSRGTGVFGLSDGALGVIGIANDFPAVYGRTITAQGTVGQSDEFIGVSGYGKLIGTRGEGAETTQTAPAIGVLGQVSFAGDNSPGVVGDSLRGPGVVGQSRRDQQGQGGPYPGVIGTNIERDAPGVLGMGSIGVAGGIALPPVVPAGGPPTRVGVYGSGNRGVVGNGRAVGVDAVGREGPGLIARSATPLAGWFNGDVVVTGTLSKGGGGFRIDHPQDPENKYLTHSFVESSERKNVYDGVARLDENGETWVDLPEWFEALNGDLRYQLTAVGGAAPNLHVAEELSENRFKIAGGEDGMKVCWQVTGSRKDPWAAANRFEVEEDKAEGERGHYLHPDLYSQPEEQGIGFVRFPEEAQQIEQQLEELQLPELASILDDPRLEEQRQQLEELGRRYPPPSESTESSEE
jgi:hypothetical protein